MKPPITWLGNKARLAAKIISHFPKHQTYCEPFGGSAAVLLAKPPSPVEIYNDIDGDLVNFYRVIRDPGLFARFMIDIDATLYSRDEFALALQQTDDIIESARRFMVRQRQSHGGLGKTWSYSIGDSVSGISSSVRRWQSGIERLPGIHTRMRNVQIEHDDWQKVMQRFDGPDTLFYLDPPYIPDTRVSGTYAHELTYDDHRTLVDYLQTVKGMVVLSGYKHEIYTPLEDNGWLRYDYDVPAYVSDGRLRRVECIWLSPTRKARSYLLS